MTKTRKLRIRYEEIGGKLATLEVKKNTREFTKEQEAEYNRLWKEFITLEAILEI